MTVRGFGLRRTSTPYLQRSYNPSKISNRYYVRPERATAAAERYLPTTLTYRQNLHHFDNDIPQALQASSMLTNVAGFFGTAAGGLSNTLGTATNTVSQGVSGVTNATGNVVTAGGKGLGDAVTGLTKGVGDTTKGT
jgi:hypothetical protein